MFTFNGVIKSRRKIAKCLSSRLVDIIAHVIMLGRLSAYFLQLSYLRHTAVMASMFRMNFKSYWIWCDFTRSTSSSKSKFENCDDVIVSCFFRNEYFRILRSEDGNAE